MKNLPKISDEALAKKLRKACTQNAELAYEMERRGYTLFCKTNGHKLRVITGNDVRIFKQETVEI